MWILRIFTVTEEILGEGTLSTDESFTETDFSTTEGITVSSIITDENLADKICVKLIILVNKSIDRNE